MASGMLRSQSSFEDLPGVSEDGNQILRNIFVGLGLCKNGIWLPHIMLDDHVYTSLFDLETRLMRWAQAQQSSKNKGFEVWHAKYLAGCCFLVGSKISVNRQTSATQTTTRTTRCAVSMINEVIKEVFGFWGNAAFSILPALAMRKYMLASVARHSEQKRMFTIPEVCRNVAQRFENPGPPEYHFNPVTLFSRLTGEDEATIASWLGLPHAPGMARCSWQDMGLTPVQNYVNIVSAEAVSKSNQGTALTRPLGHSSLTHFDYDVFRPLPSTSAARSLAPASYSHEPAHSSIGSVETWRNNVVPVQGRTDPPVTLHPSSRSPWLAPSEREARGNDKEPGRISLEEWDESNRVPHVP